MADFDPPGGGSSEWTDTGSAVTPSGGETVGTGSEDVDVGSVSTEEINNTVAVPPGGDLDTELSNVKNNAGLDTIRLLPGTHLRSSPWVIDAAVDIEIPSGAELKMADAANLNFLIDGQTGGLSISGTGTINGNSQNQSSGLNRPIKVNAQGDDVMVRDVTVINWSVTGRNPAIILRNGNNTTVDNVRVGGGSSPGTGFINIVSDTPAGAVYEGATVSNCTLGPCNSNGGDGIFIDGTSGDGNAFHEVSITGNTFVGKWSTGHSTSSALWAINMEESAKAVSITGNVAYSATNDGSGGFIFVNPQNSITEYVTVTGNVGIGSTTSNGASGIDLKAPNVTATGNIALQFSDTNCKVRDGSHVVVGNQFNNDIFDVTSGSAVIANNG